MDDPLLVSVLHRLADRDEQLEPFAERQPAFVAEPGDGDALDQLHDKVGATRVGRAGVEDLGDVGMVHERQRWRSAANRASTWRLSIPALIIFSATVRLIGRVCSAMKTVPMPPSPMVCKSLYGPMSAPASSVAGAEPTVGVADAGGDSKKFPA